MKAAVVGRTMSALRPIDARDQVLPHSAELAQIFVVGRQNDRAVAALAFAFLRLAEGFVIALHGAIEIVEIRVLPEALCINARRLCVGELLGVLRRGPAAPPRVARLRGAVPRSPPTFRGDRGLPQLL